MTATNRTIFAIFLLISTINCQTDLKIKPIFGDLIQSNCSLSDADIIGITNNLQHIIQDRPYNRISSKGYLAGLLQKDNFSFERWTQSKGWDKFPKIKGGDCVDASEALIESLSYSFNAQIIPSRLPGRYQQKNAPEFCHVAVLLKYSRDNLLNYMLLEPGFDVARPIILNSNQRSATLNTSKGSWSFSLNQDTIECDSEHFGLNRETQVPDKMIYYLKKFQNYRDHIKQTLVFSDLAPSIVVKNRDGDKLSHIKIDLKKNKLLWCIKEDSHEQSFDELINSGFKDNFNNLELYVQKEVLDKTRQEILTIVRNKSAIISLSEKVN
jgi:hypothetical protein